MAQPSQRGELAVRAVVMECRIRLCATTDRVDRFVENARRVVSDALPGSVVFSILAHDVDSRLLVRQWNGSNPSMGDLVPVAVEIELLLAGGGWLTGARLESLSRDVLADIEPRHRGGGQQVVPWILTLTTELDDRYSSAEMRRTLLRRHPDLAAVLGAPANPGIGVAVLSRLGSGDGGGIGV